MNIPVTDKFLWEVYKHLEKANIFADFVFSSKYNKSKILMRDVNPVFERYKREMGRREFSRFIYYLKRKNYIRSESLKGKKALIITKEGLSKALKSSFDGSNKIKRKDGKWIMLMFDIPQSNRKARNLLKSILINLGYKLFQQSVWITSYDVHRKTEMLLQLHSLDKYVKILLVEEI